MFLCLYLDTDRGLTGENLGSNCFQFPDGCPKYPTPKLPVAVFFLFFRKDAERSKSCKTAKTALFEGNFKPLCAWRNAAESRACRGFVPGPQ